MEYQKITKISKNAQQNNSETVTNENDKEIPKEIYVSPEERQKISGNLKSIIIVCNGRSRNNKLLRQYTKLTYQIYDKTLA